jgi:rubrerythrin
MALLPPTRVERRKVERRSREDRRGAAPKTPHNTDQLAKFDEMWHARVNIHLIAEYMERSPGTCSKLARKRGLKERYVKDADAKLERRRASNRRSYERRTKGKEVPLMRAATASKDERRTVEAKREVPLAKLPPERMRLRCQECHAYFKADLNNNSTCPTCGTIRRV